MRERLRSAIAETWPALLLAVYAQAEAWTLDQAVSRAAAAGTALVMTLPLLARRRAPLAAMAASIGATFGRELVGVPLNEGVTPILVMLLALYAVGTYAERRRAAAGLAGALLLVLATMALSPAGAADFPFIALFLAGPWGAAVALRVRQERAEALESRASRAEREADERAARARADERTRIARELHDVVAHSVSVMTIQAGGVRRLLRPEQRREREALESVETTGRQALAELRRLLGLLRDDDGAPGLAPQPSLQHLEALLHHVREAGLPVDLRIEGEPAPLAPGVDLSAYRIVQEALTNTLKHGGEATATVIVRYAADALELEVADDGGGANGANGGGHGLVGMQERAAVYGGQVEAGPREGGFGVRVRLPLT
jgi:signal transduction histidine kinase